MNKKIKKNVHIDNNYSLYMQTIKVLDDFYKWLYGDNYDFSMSLVYLQYKEYLQTKLNVLEDNI